MKHTVYIAILKGLNTYHVIVQLSYATPCKSYLLRLNTSYVSVQLWLKKDIRKIKNDLNTFYVSVQPYKIRHGTQL